MKVLVIGGTRFIGPAAVLSLVDRGADVTVLHRGETMYDFGSDVQHLFADRSEVVEHAGGRTRARVKGSTTLADIAPLLVDEPVTQFSFEPPALSEVFRDAVRP